ncbi:MAG: hypothetical protein AAFN08_10830 [Cyanobacteria bacterium J06559_3]
MPARQSAPKTAEFVCKGDINFKDLGGMKYMNDRVTLPADHPVTKALLSQGKIVAFVEPEAKEVASE